MSSKTELSNITPHVLLANAGSIWLSMSDSPGFLGWARAVLEAFEQVELDMLAQRDALGVSTVQLYRTKLWTPLDFPQADIDEADVELATYDGTYTHDATINYDVPISYGRRWTLDLPVELVSIGCLVDRPVDPEVVLVRGVDFEVADGQITFASNPSELGFPVVYVENEPVVRCWAYGAEQDKRWTFNHFGHVFSESSQASSESYRTLVQQLFGYLQSGPTIMGLRFALASLLGIKLVGAEVETVEAINTNYGVLTVITDRDVYQFDAEATLTVEVGDTVRRGDVLVDSLSIYEGADVATFDLVDAIALEPGHIKAPISGAVVFPSEATSTTYELDADTGIAHVTFELGGAPDDVTLFWDTVRTAESAGTGRTVARALTTNPKAGEPESGEIPATASPMRFLLEYVLAVHGVIVYIKSHAAAELSMPAVANIVRRMLPPHVFALVFVELDLGTEIADEADEPTVTDSSALVGTPSNESMTPTSYFVDAFQV